MRRWEVVGAVFVLLAIALGFTVERPAPPDVSAFGERVALAPALDALEAPGGTLELDGVLRTASGEPVEEGFLTLLRSEDDPSEAEPLYHAYTDATGRFAFHAVAPGSYRVLLTHPSAPPRTFELDLEQSQEVAWTLAPPLAPLPSLPSIERSMLDGRMRMPEAVLGPGPDALADFEVVLVPATETPLLAGAGERRVTTEADGHFHLEDVVFATYRVEVLPPWARGGSWPVLARSSWTAGSAAPLELPLSVGSIEGQVQEPGERPLAGALVRIAALDAPDPVGQPELWPPQVTDAAGHFQVELLPPGRYQVHLRAGLAAMDVEIAVAAGGRAVVPTTVLEQPPGSPGGG